MEGRGVGLFAAGQDGAREELQKTLAYLDAIADTNAFREEMKALGRAYLSQYASSGFINAHNNQRLAAQLRDYDPPKTFQPLDHWGELLKIYKQFKQTGTLSDGIEKLWVKYFRLNQKFLENLTLTTPIAARHHYFSEVLTYHRSMWVLKEEMKRRPERLFHPQDSHETPSV